jgi:isocitrate lyase
LGANSPITPGKPGKYGASAHENPYPTNRRIKQRVDEPRWEGITRPYSAEDVVKLRGSVNPECTLAQLGAAKMWRLLHGEAKKATSTASAR